MNLNRHISPIIECIPNFSEGRRIEVVHKLINAVENVNGVKLMRSEMDANHNRSVLSFIGPPKAVLQAAFLASEQALENIDLTSHDGVHPRIGAVDVIPIVPIKGISIKECVVLAETLGEKISKQLHIPVYFYEEAAKMSQRKNLANIRKGGFESLIKNDLSPDRLPDLGGPQLHPTAGAVAIGVRKPLIAYNINLNTSDVEIAKKIARNIREKDGGLPAVKALGLRLGDKCITQVSMNLIDYKATSLAVVYEKVEEEAKKYGVNVIESELIGLINLDAIIESWSHFIKLKSFDITRVLDYHLNSPYDNQIESLETNEK